MPRGGFRPGAGRKRIVGEAGAAQIKPKKPASEAGKKRAERLNADRRASPGAGAIGAATIKRAKPPPGTVIDQIVHELKRPDETPLQYMLRIMRDPLQPNERRDMMAIKAASYLHPRLTGVAFEMAPRPEMQIGDYKKPELEGEQSNNLEIARRIAFALAMGAAKAKEAA
jgi:phage terminase small subunit